MKNTIRHRPPGHLTGAQLRAARALARVTIAELAARAGLAQGTINRAESVDGFAPITPANSRLLVATLEAAGVIFVSGDDIAGPGVRLRAVDGGTGLED